MNTYARKSDILSEIYITELLGANNVKGFKKILHQEK